MGRSDLERLSKEELIELALRLQRPEKTSRTSSNQTCLAHLARDVAYAVEVSEDPVPWRLQLWLNTVFALSGAGQVATLAVSTLAAKRRALERRLASIL